MLKPLLTTLLLLSLALLLITTTGGCASRAVKPSPSGVAAELPGDKLPHGEELWIIARKAPAENPSITIQATPTLLARLPNQLETRPIPPSRTDVQADIAGCVATVDVAQQFRNPFPATIEAVYTFPLPDDASVTEFIMTIGQRKIRGILRDRDDAQRLYHAARAQGYLASLLTQTRPNTLTQSIANIEPHQQIDINLRYLNTLPYTDGQYTYRFPAKGLSNVSLQLHLKAGVKLEDLRASSHSATQNVEGSNAIIILAPQSTPGPADFLLRYRVAGGRLKASPLPPTHLDTIHDFLSIDATRRK
jgi:Ca-activated chloride channel family protein